MIAWARFAAGAGPVHEGNRLWDYDGKYPGISPAFCRDCRARPGPPCPCPQPRLLDDAWPGVLAYLGINTQWRYAPNGMPTGLAYGDCLPTLQQRCPRIARDTGKPVTVDDLFDDVQVIERAMIEAAVERAREREDI